MRLMTKNTNTVTNQEERSSKAPGSGANACCADATHAHAHPAGAHAPAHPVVPQKTKLEKTQSLLTVVSTSIGLMGVAGSVFAMGLATFYTGAV